jgi:hypothetical protein
MSIIIIIIYDYLPSSSYSACCLAKREIWEVSGLGYSCAPDKKKHLINLFLLFFNNPHFFFITLVRTCFTVRHFLKKKK